MSGKILETIHSPYNGELKIIDDPHYGVYISGAGLDQSGRAVSIIWARAIDTLESQEVENALILGLGGGSVAEIINRKFTNCKITGVDIDSVIVELGKKYMNLDNLNTEIIIQDAFEFKTENKDKKYDLICVDTYVGDKFPEKFESAEFLHNLSEIISSGGLILFNRTYHDENKQKADKFHQTLKKVFGRVDVIYPELNAIYMCRL